MNQLRQILVVSLLGFKSLRHRIWPSLVVVSGVACVVAVLVTVLSLTAGITQAYSVSTNPARVILISKSAQDENGSLLPQEAVNFAEALPTVRKAPNGRALADPEVVASFPVDKKNSGLSATIIVRGISSQGLLMHPGLRIVSGRMFRPGTAELIVGAAAQRQFASLAIGDSFAVQHGRWRIVGIFEAGGDILEGEMLGDAATLLPAVGRTGYSALVVDLNGPGSFDRFKSDITTSPKIQAAVERQSDYLARTTQRFAGLFDTIAYVIAGLMAIGAIFGTVNTLYAAVSSRSREIATLRALGYGSVAVALSVLLEAMFLSLTGAVIGAMSAWIFFDGKQKVLSTNVFSLSVTPALIATGILWAMAIAFVGASLPSIKAARMPVAAALAGS